VIDWAKVIGGFLGMPKRDNGYTGRDNLEAMAEAKNYNKFLISLIGENKELSKKRILDFGAGSGTYADMLKEQGVLVDCLEPDGVLYRQLGKKGYDVYRDIKELQPNSYDVIYALNVLEHIEDDEAVVTALTTALRKGGKLVIYVPAFQILFTSMDKKVGHFRRYRKKALNSHAQKASLKVNNLYYCDPLGFCAALTFKYVGNKDGVVSARAVKIYDRYIFPLSKVIQPIFKKSVGKNVVLVAEK
jgi:SAM-dependent methyltransferase